MTASPNPVSLATNGDQGKLKRTVTVTVTVTGGYCLGLRLEYVTGAPNGQYVQNLGDGPTYVAQLLGHPSGSELWSAGDHVLTVKDGFGNFLNSTVLVVQQK